MDMRTYIVGGAIRDELLGLDVEDKDYVVVGTTPEAMLARGFTPVGKDFPVFLHPKTGEEYALARTERSTAPGYKGFTFHTSPDVTLEEDLIRRDLTINAMAKEEDGTLIDPFGGEQDLRDGIFRHVSDAFEEDPVRILRLARFAARFTGFAVAPETLALMQKMVDRGDVDALVPERVWQEFSRGLMEERPSRMFDVLRDCGALAHILPELDALWGVPQPEVHHPEIDTGVHVMTVLNYAAKSAFPLEVRFAALMHDLGKGRTPPEDWPSHHGHEELGVPLVQAICERVRVPNACRDLALMTAREHGNIGRGLSMSASGIVRVFERCDAIRRPERFLEMLKATESDFRGRGDEDSEYTRMPYPQAAFWQAVLDAVLAVDAGAVAQAHQENPRHIPVAIHEARVNSVKQVLANEADKAGHV